MQCEMFQFYFRCYKNDNISFSPTFVGNHFIHSYYWVHLIYTYIVLIVFLGFPCIIVTDSTLVSLFIFNLFFYLFSPLFVLIIEQANRTSPVSVSLCLNFNHTYETHSSIRIKRKL